MRSGSYTPLLRHHHTCLHNTTYLPPHYIPPHCITARCITALLSLQCTTREAITSHISISHTSPSRTLLPLRYSLSSVLQSANLETGHQPDIDLCEGVGHLLLDELRVGQRTAKLYSVEGVVPRGVKACLGGPQSAPGDTVPGVIQTAERSLPGRMGGVGVSHREVRKILFITTFIITSFASSHYALHHSRHTYKLSHHIHYSLFIHSFIHSFTHYLTSFIHSFINPFIHLFNYLFILSIIHACYRSPFIKIFA